MRDFSEVNETVPDLKSLNELFAYLRDTRFLDSDKTPGLKRRIPWLYLQNGCSDRATLMRELIEKRHMTVPTRLFAFAPEGQRLMGANPYFDKPFSWGEYHTALVTRVEGMIYVLDPGMEPTRPLPIREWVTRLGNGNPSDISIAICSPLSSSAERSCHEKDPRLAFHILYTQGLLDRELEEIKNLKPQYQGDPYSVLGDSPPWRVQNGICPALPVGIQCRMDIYLNRPVRPCGP